jgi:pimeloyl-ACP methyl ester carboxylesterase
MADGEKGKQVMSGGGNPVLVLHGLSMNRQFMSGIAGHLKRKGREVINISYPSRAKSFEELCDEFVVPAIHGAKGQKVDAVVHSMGGLLLRLYAEKYGTEKIGRVVMIGTPNHGSEVADYLRPLPAYKWFHGPVGQRLGTGREDVHAKLKDSIDFDCGVIAGNNRWFHAPTTLLAKIPVPNDGIVSVASTRINGMKDHVEVWGDHTLMCWMPSVWKLASTYLAKGSFKD